MSLKIADGFRRKFNRITVPTTYVLLIMGKRAPLSNGLKQQKYHYGIYMTDTIKDGKQTEYLNNHYENHQQGGA